MADRVSEVLLEITPDHQIARIIIREADGASTEFQFRAQAEDVNVADQEFHFNVPAGVEVVSGELGP
jgi:outer membrane lipoprotein-sorting protein